MENLGSRWTDPHEVSLLMTFTKNMWRKLNFYLPRTIILATLYEGLNIFVITVAKNVIMISVMNIRNQE